MDIRLLNVLVMSTLELGRDGLVAGRGGGGNEDTVVDERGERSADERADPVYPVIFEVPGYHGRAEGSPGIHRRAGERGAHEDLGQDCEADGERRDHPDRALVGIHGGGEYDEHEGEGEHNLHQHGGEAGHVCTDCMACDVLTRGYGFQNPGTCTHSYLVLRQNIARQNLEYCLFSQCSYATICLCIIGDRS